MTDASSQISYKANHQGMGQKEAVYILNETQMPMYQQAYEKKVVYCYKNEKLSFNSNGCSNAELGKT